MAAINFIFFLVHKSGYQALGASRKQGDRYIMFRLFHPDAHVYDRAGARREFERMGDMGGDEIQHLIESGEWELEGAHPYN